MAGTCQGCPQVSKSSSREMTCQAAAWLVTRCVLCQACRDLTTISSHLLPPPSLLLPSSSPFLQMCPHHPFPKVRKLEFLLADAKLKGCDTVITCGSTQSNHCRATAVAAAELGFKSHLFLRWQGEMVRVWMGKRLCLFSRVGMNV